MIPTQFKAKIPQLLSYPVGAKAISDALAGVPHGDLLSIWFSCGRRQMHRAERYEVLNITYRNVGPDGPKWTVTVYAVPRSLRHQIQAMLLATALPRIRQCLVENADKTGRDGTYCLTFSYDELSNDLESEEDSSVSFHTARP